MENFLIKIRLTGCKWPNLNAPSTETPVSHPLLGESLFSYIQPLSCWGNKNWTPQYKDKDDGKTSEQNQLNRLQMAQFECLKYRNPCVSSTFE